MQKLIIQGFGWRVNWAFVWKWFCDFLLQLHTLLLTVKTGQDSTFLRCNLNLKYGMLEEFNVMNY